jgi:hypothetical protein
MTIPIPSAALVPAAPVFTNTERLALAASWLATAAWPAKREAWELDLRCGDERIGFSHPPVPRSGCRPVLWAVVGSG